MPVPIAAETDGLREALKAMTKAERMEVGKELRAEFNELATDVIAAAKARAGTRMRQRAADTLRPGSTSLGAAVFFGRGFAGAFGAEYGAYSGQRRITKRGYVSGWNQFDFWRGSDSDAGYFLWPAIRAEVKSNLDDLADRLAEILAEV